MDGRTYLPPLDFAALSDALRARAWDRLPALVEGLDNYDRLGLDRLLIIAADLQERMGRMDGLDVLDVGCNNGLFSVGLAALGNRVTGIDNLAVDGQARYEALRLPAQGAGTARLLTMDVGGLLASEPAAQWDVTLLLSVTHQWEFGYAHDRSTAISPERIRELMNELVTRTRACLYYECPVEEPGFAPGYGWEFIERFVQAPVRMNDLGLTVGSSGYPRQLFRIDRM